MPIDAKMKIIENIASGVTHPAIYNARVVVAGLKVGGFSARFVNLRGNLQKEIINSIPF